MNMPSALAADERKEAAVNEPDSRISVSTDSQTSDTRLAANASW
jgi:hypothetical protein